MLKLLFIFFAFFILQSRKILKAKKSKVYCSLIFDKNDCLKSDQCMWIKTKTVKVYYIGNQNIEKCFEKKFFINTIKSNMFPEKFSDKSDADLIEEVGLKD